MFKFDNLMTNELTCRHLYLWGFGSEKNVYTVIKFTRHATTGLNFLLGKYIVAYCCSWMKEYEKNLIVKSDCINQNVGKNSLSPLLESRVLIWTTGLPQFISDSLWYLVDRSHLWLLSKFWWKKVQPILEYIQ